MAPGMDSRAPEKGKEIMDCVQFAGHVNLSGMAPHIHGTYGPFRGVVRATRPDVEEVTGRYTRVWLTNGYGVLILERDGYEGLWLVPIRHAGEIYPETVWLPLNEERGTLLEGEPLYMAAGTVSGAVSMLDAMRTMPGHDMGGVE